MGHIYFFYRPRVSVENPQSLQDVQRSYILLRPLPSGTKFKSDNPEVGEEGSPRPLEDAGDNNRLLAVPKKKFPATGSHERLLWVLAAYIGASISSICDIYWPWLLDYVRTYVGHLWIRQIVRLKRSRRLSSKAQITKQRPRWCNLSAITLQGHTEEYRQP